jgi:hypothetical protein
MRSLAKKNDQFTNKKSFFYLDFKNVIIVFTVITLSLPMFSIHEPGVGPGGCDFETEFYFGISSIETVPGWSPFCNFEAGDEWFNPFGNEVNLVPLVNQSYGGFSANNWNWWIEGGWGDAEFCLDDDTFSGLIAFGNCIEGETASGNCPLNVWVQVVGECDNCVNNNFGGTWYKAEFTIDVDDIGTSCGGETNMAMLLRQPRTNCNDPEYPWGCGPNEFQE